MKVIVILDSQNHLRAMAYNEINLRCCLSALLDYDRKKSVMPSSGRQRASSLLAQQPSAEELENFLFHYGGRMCDNLFDVVDVSVDWHTMLGPSSKNEDLPDLTQTDYPNNPWITAPGDGRLL